ncbi:MAG: outer membrane beta-barrel domain-containing protein [Bdellovibrionaceae bacterium]|nr:outer membrane beta-barrel domain-containing protein [Pseudobdellovibrionaceae bacterium]
MKRFTLILLGLLAFNAWSDELTGKMDALGANKDLMRKARAIDPQNRIRVVQNREVDRYYRFELGLNYGMATGGDPYVNTDILGGQLDFHITPRWSLGARYYNSNNKLNAEGKKVFDAAERENAAGNNNFRRPGVDYAKDTWLAIGNWYPIYGKMNLFDATVAQFDIYFLGGAGQVNLSSGTAPIYTAGAGFGVWFTQHFASRLEARWQGYQDKVWDGFESKSRSIDQTMLSATVSFLL